MPFAVSILQLAPPWLLGDNGKALLQTFGQQIDALAQQLKDGIKARFPDTAPTDALPLIGRDRGLESGPLESADNFRGRLKGAVATAQTRGSAATLLRQLAAFFSGIGTPPIRLVSENGAWHEYDYPTDTVTKTYASRDRVGSWSWDGTFQPWRGWVIIDGASLGWWPWKSGTGVPFDGSYVMGSTAPATYVQQIQRLVQKWKPAHVYVPRIIVTFVPSMFTNPPDAEHPRRGPKRGPRNRIFLKTPENPRGQYGDETNFNLNATYWPAGGEEP